MGRRYNVVVTNNVAGATTISWIIDRDSFARYLTSNAGNSIVSDDPTLTVAEWATPTATRKGERFVMIYSSGLDFNIFLPKGTKLYFAFSAKDSAILVLEEGSLAVPS
jgi:hypothetical protein